MTTNYKVTNGCLLFISFLFFFFFVCGFLLGGFKNIFNISNAILALQDFTVPHRQFLPVCVFVCLFVCLFDGLLGCCLFVVKGTTCKVLLIPTCKPVFEIAVVHPRQPNRAPDNLK